MKIMGTSREGCWAVLILSGVVLLLGRVGDLKYELDVGTFIFAALNLVGIYGLLRCKPKKS